MRSSNNTASKPGLSPRYNDVLVTESKGMWDYTKICFKKYADFNGRARRSEYWYFELLNVLVLLFFAIPVAALMVAQSDLYYIPLVMLILWQLIVLLPSISSGVRRLHDTGRSGWFILMAIIPLLGLIVLYFLIKDSEPGINAWGPNPKNVSQDDDFL